MSIAVEIINANKKIKDKSLINNISLTINKGEVFGLLGPNGAGKTTLIRMIVGLISITSGDILINNKSIATNFKEAISDIGALVESPALYKHLSGYDNLKIFGRMSHNVSESKIQNLIDSMGLSLAIHERVNNYSLGMKQRLGIALALLNDPSVLILDEPTNGLDPQGILELRNNLKKLAAERNISVIVSSHMLSEMNLLCDRFAIINKGKLASVTSKENYDIGTEIEYLIEVNNAVQAFQSLRDNYSTKLVDEKLFVTLNKKEISKVISELIKLNIEIYAVTPTQNSLEKFYFEVVSGKDF